MNKYPDLIESKSTEKDCFNCKFLCFDSCLNGYCSNKNSCFYRNVVVNDNGCNISCDDFVFKGEGEND